MPSLDCHAPMSLVQLALQRCCREYTSLASYSMPAARSLACAGRPAGSALLTWRCSSSISSCTSAPSLQQRAWHHGMRGRRHQQLPTTHCAMPPPRSTLCAAHACSPQGQGIERAAVTALPNKHARVRAQTLSQTLSQTLAVLTAAPGRSRPPACLLPYLSTYAWTAGKSAPQACGAPAGGEKSSARRPWPWPGPSPASAAPPAMPGCAQHSTEQHDPAAWGGARAHVAACSCRRLPGTRLEHARQRKRRFIGCRELQRLPPLMRMSQTFA